MKIPSAAAPLAPARLANVQRRLHSRILALLASAVLLSAALGFWIRAYAAWNASRIAPGASLTSGFEEESLFALWRAAHDHTVYIDPFAIPYASAYFNWLFYVTYTVPARIAVALEGDAAIPRASRVATAAFALGGTAILFWLLRRILPKQRGLALALAAFVFIGPLVGWWAHTVRPDVGALACETAALTALLLLHRTHPARAVALSCALFYAAWAFKPTFVGGLGAAILFLASFRQWRLAITLAGGVALLVAVTLALATEGYLACLVDTATTNEYYVALGLSNSGSAALKLAPLLLLLVGLPSLRHAHAPLASLPRDAVRLGLLGVAVTLPLAGATSCKLGAAPNYFLSVAPPLALIAAGTQALQPRFALQTAAFVGMLALYLAPLTGRFGRIDLDDQTSSLAQRWAVHSALPEPRYSVDHRLNLPWLNPASPPLILAFNYPLNRAAGRRFEAGGLGGLIESGYFASLLLPAGNLRKFDGGNLHRYRATASVDGLTAYVRNDFAARK